MMGIAARLDECPILQLNPSYDLPYDFPFWASFALSA
jgi:hypothetical protein